MTKKMHFGPKNGELFSFFFCFSLKRCYIKQKRGTGRYSVQRNPGSISGRVLTGSCSEEKERKRWDEEKEALVIVPDFQLSLAIGRAGQNARLSAKLTGYKIDIKSETEARESGLFEEIGYIDDYSNDAAEEEAYTAEEEA